MKISPFETNDAYEINEARGTFLKSFLPKMIQEAQLITGLDVGCGGLGYFSMLLKDQGLKVTAFDARLENVIQAQKLNPSIDFKLHDIEDPSVINLGAFDLVLCFGVLYHLENPFRAVRNLYALTKKYLIIESQTAPCKSSSLILYEESRSINQSINYVVCMPTESSIIKMLYKAGFSSVYKACAFPDHEDFRSSLTRRRVRTLLLASKEEGRSLKKWGGVEFGLIREPKVPTVSPLTWYSKLGKLFLVRKPKTFILSQIDWWGKLIPCKLIHILCKHLARPKPLRRWPGWTLGNYQDYQIGNIIRFLFWRWFSSRCLNDTLVVAWHKQIRVYAYPGNETSQELFVTGCYEPNELSFLENVLKPGMVFVDIGSNMGLYTLFASKLVGEEGVVVAIEPSDREFDWLKANLELNHCSNVEAISAAVSDCSTNAELLIAENAHSGHNTLGSFSYPGVLIVRRQRVQKKPLDDLIRQQGLQRVDVIKIDVEGHELFVLKGALDTIRRFRPILLIELFNRSLDLQGCKSEEVLDLLKEAGYHIYVFDKKTGLPVPLQGKTFQESENIVAVHETSNKHFI
jgi:FkbM family methyltransferase